MSEKQSLWKKISKSLSNFAGFFKGAWFKATALNYQWRWLGAVSGASMEKNWLIKPGQISHIILRQLAKHDPVVRICVQVIKKNISQSQWHIAVHKNAPKWKNGYNKQKQEITEFFEFADMNGENLRVMLDRVMEDLLVLDAGAIELVRSLDGKKIIGFNSVDGETIRPLYTDRGELGEIAYKQFVGGKETASFKEWELVYMMANPQNDVNLFWYGMSNIESILMQVQASLEADMYNIKHFSKDNIPPGLLNLGAMDDDQAADFVALWNATVMANPHGMKFVWGQGNNIGYTPFNTSNKDMQYSEYIDWLTRIKLAAYGLTGIDANIFHDTNRANSQVQAQISNSRWVASYRHLIEEYFTSKIIRQFGEEYKWLEFKFDEFNGFENRKKLAEIHAIYVGAGVLSANEVREELGYEEIDGLESPEFMSEGEEKKPPKKLISSHDEDLHGTEDPNYR